MEESDPKELKNANEGATDDTLSEDDFMIDVDRFYSNHPKDDQPALNARTKEEGIPTTYDAVIRLLPTATEIDNERGHKLSDVS